MEQANSCLKNCAADGLERAMLTLAKAQHRKRVQEEKYSTAEKELLARKRHLEECEARETELQVEVPQAQDRAEQLSIALDRQRGLCSESADALKLIGTELKQNRDAHRNLEKRLFPLESEEKKWSEELHRAIQAFDDADRHREHQRRELMAAKQGKQELQRVLDERRKEWNREKRDFAQALLHQQQDIRESVRGNEIKTRVAMITTNLLYGPMLRTLLSVFDCTHTELGSCSMQLDVMPATACFESIWHMLMAAFACTALMMLLPGVMVARGSFQMMEPKQGIFFQPRHLFLLTATTTLLMGTSVFIGRDTFAWQKLQICLLASLTMLVSLPFLPSCTWRPLIVLKVQLQASRESVGCVKISALPPLALGQVVGYIGAAMLSLSVMLVLWIQEDPNRGVWGKKSHQAPDPHPSPHPCSKPWPLSRIVPTPTPGT